ncbi:MAG: asparaginase [Ilumatobacteraceae bacterium]
MATPEAFAPVAITRRSGCDESVHFGAVVGLSTNGSVAFAVGDPTTPIYPRSSNKPMQAVAMARAGLQLPPELLALVCASHDGTPMHVDAARRILATAGLDERSLANTADLPLDAASAENVLRSGGGRTALQMNCSGKHSGMLVTSAINGWPTDSSYLSPGHPLQQHITATIDDLTGEQHSHIGVDGCGAPAHVISLLGLARGFRSIATGAAGLAGDAVYQAMTTYPEMVGGDRRDVTQFMRNISALMAKDGADGVFAAALPDGRAVALKIADGANRARPPVMVAALRALGIDTSGVDALVTQWILGHGSHVGEVRAIAP